MFNRCFSQARFPTKRILLLAVSLSLECVGEAFPTPKHNFQAPFRILREQCVDMVRHHGERDHVYTLAIKVEQSARDKIAAIRPAQDAFTVSRIEPELTLAFAFFA